MLRIAQYQKIPLPKGWPRRVRSAIIQVICLAHFSLITTRSWAVLVHRILWSERRP
jgi:hypothetical protein